MTIKNHWLAIGTLAATCLFASCIDEEDNKHTGYGYFTITGSLVAGYQLHQDGGGTVIPTTASVSTITNGKGFEGLEIERALLSYSYSDKDISADKKTIEIAEINGGSSIEVYNPLAKDQAEEKGVLEADSIFDAKSVSGIWAYRGYITIVNKSQYVLNEKKDNAVIPTFNLVYDPTEQIPDQLNLTLCINEHHKKDVTPSGTSEFTNSFRLSPMLNSIPGTDSVKVSLNVQGSKAPYTFKVARKDFVKGDWN